MFKKYLVALMVLCIVILGCSCTTNNVSQSEGSSATSSELEIAEKCLIPASYFAFSKLPLDEAYKSYSKYIGEFFTSVNKSDEGLMVEMTADQRASFIKHNDEYIERLISSFKRLNGLYKCIEDSDYKTLEFDYDETIPQNTEARYVWGVVNTYGLNYILKTNSPEWTVHVVIKNCHTGKEVISITVPHDEGSYGENEWKKSYE